MMKIILPLISSILLSNNISMIVIYLSFMLMMILLLFNTKHMMIMDNSFLMDKFSMILILLTLMSILLIMFSSQHMKTISKMIIPIFIILMLTFSTMNMLSFYILFELVLIPTMILVMKSGKQPERLQASIYLMLYTIMASLPLLVSIILMNYNKSFIMSFMMMYKVNMPLLFMMAFLVKMPMFFTHLWLPKAHVEAPLEGSMILAAILLKLGGYGLIRFIPLCIHKINKINHWIISISMIGATCTSLNCIRQKDLKSLIAYSSVAHMALVILSLFTMNYIGLMGAMIMMIAHGLSSSALFLLTNDLYHKYHTRNISSFKGLMIMMPNITFWWFIFMSINISAPPSINTISEIMIMSSIILWNMKSMILIFIISIMTTSFSMMMFLNLSHNKNEMISSEQSKMKLFSSLFIHMIPLILILFKMDSMIMYLSSLNKTMVCGTMISLIMLMSLLIMIIAMITLTLSIYTMINNTFIYIIIPLINLNTINLSFSFIMDWISCLFLTTVLMISSMILMFSMYYIPKKEHKKFSLMLIMFVLSMIILIISNNMFLVLLGWDMLGLSSYILVIYYQNNSASGSGSITLLSNRIGDIFILLSISMMMFNSMWELNMNESFPLIIMMMLMLTSCTKSAQFPFSAWLPMAMSAPTPISALVHSSTLVTAGVFLMIRISSNSHPMTMYIIMIISSMTALYAGLSANWEQDLKKIIALSTLSQMAMMMFAISIMSPYLAYFHMIIHAFFKSLMFMCAGIMIHETSYQDMRMMSMNMINMPMVSTILGLTNMALMGLPFTSGFFSKDMIIEKMICSKMECILTLIMISSIGMTASYSIRMMYLSNKYMIKCKSDLNNHSSLYSNIPIMLMSPMAILMGSILMWILNPEQILFFPNIYKIIILCTLTTGFIMGMMLSFKNKKYIKMGLYSIALWSIHFMSTKMMTLFSPLMNMYFKNDKNWQETYGPYKMFLINKKMTNLPESKNLSIMTTLLLISMIPIMILL